MVLLVGGKNSCCMASTCQHGGKREQEGQRVYGGYCVEQAVRERGGALDGVGAARHSWGMGAWGGGGG